MKKILVIVTILFSSLLLFSCSKEYIQDVYSNDKKIASEVNSFNLNTKNQTVTNNNLSSSFTLEGMDTIWSYEAKEDSTAILTYSLTVHSGIFKIVLIDSSGKVTTLIEEKENFKTDQPKELQLNLKKGNNRIKVLAKNDAKIDMNLSCEVGSFTSVGFD